MDSAAHSPLRRLRDKADVVELILRRKPPRDLPVAPAVRSLHRETWDALQAETERLHRHWPASASAAQK